MTAVVALGLLVTTALGLWLWRATTRTKREMQQARSMHRQALRALVTDGKARELADDAGWARIAVDAGEMELHLGVSGVLRNSTYISYTTTLDLVTTGNAFRLPEREALAHRDSPPDRGRDGALKSLGLSASVENDLAVLTAGMELGERRLRLIARPAGLSLLRYSYGIHLVIERARIDALLDLGTALGAHLLTDGEKTGAEISAESGVRDRGA